MTETESIIREGSIWVVNGAAEPVPTGIRKTWLNENVETEEKILNASSIKESFLSTELCLREIEDKAAPGVILWWLDDFHGFLGGPTRAVHDRRRRNRGEWTKGP
jgi:hypothetical protein